MPTTTRVQDVVDFANESKRFLGVSKHFYIHRVGGSKQHHFLVKSVYYKRKQHYRVVMIHYVKSPKSSSNDSLCKRIADETLGYLAEVVGYNVDVKLHSFKFSVKDRVATFIKDDKQRGDDDREKSAGKHYFDLMEEGSWFMVTDDEYPKDEEDCDDVWETAWQLKGRSYYHVLFFNCEHFVTNLLLGKARSEQSDKACLCAAVSGACGCILGAILYLVGFSLTGAVLGAALTAAGIARFVWPSIVDNKAESKK